MKQLFLLSLFAVFSASTMASTSEYIIQNNVSIDRIGAHSGNVFYMTINEELDKPCKYKVLYCPSTEPSCKSMLSISLAAQSMSKPLVKIRYLYHNDTQLCHIWETVTQ